MTVDPEQALFERCLAAADEAARDALLAAHPDAALAARVRRLLAAHAAAESSLDLAFHEVPRLAEPLTVGSYRILERVGEGAMGEVYLAEQTQPMRRRVALKVLKFGVGTREVLARFELERQTLTLMSHANIARMLDAGTTGDGRPYFAMEFVPGVPLTRYCDSRKLGIDERLALFAQVCAGVQHAHLRGVIHRDLKPSNLLVSEIDGVPVPKIIDFGIAKATTIQPEGADPHTRLGHLLGTPEYMSPEQAQLSPLDIDARTDVYSLGVLLFELLTGERPYSITQGSTDQSTLLREILEGDIRRPSDCVESRGLRARLRGDLDWITLKALEKDRQRRYASPAELAADLARSAADEPVMAGPPTASYRVGKFVRRHRIGVAVAASLFIAAIAFGSGMAWLAREAALERDRANQEAELARRMTAFTAGLFELANPANLGARDVSASELLDAGVLRLENEARDERPEVRAALYEAAGNAYRGLGDFAKAEPLLARAVALREAAAASEPRALAAALHSQAMLAKDTGNFVEAERLMREGLALYGPGSERDIVRVRAAMDLVDVLRNQSKLDEGRSLAESSLSANDPQGDARTEAAARAHLSLGRVLAAQGELAAAERHLSRALELHVALFGDANTATLNAKDGLADALVTMDESDRAEQLLTEIVADSRRIYGNSHPEVGVALNNLGNALSDFPEKYAAAERAYLEGIEILRRSTGPNHPELGTTLNNLGGLYLRLQEWSAANDAYAEATQIRLASLGPTHPDTASTLMGQALAVNKLGKYTQAERLLRQAIVTFSAALGAEHWRVANAETYLGMVLMNLGRFREAEEVLLDSERKLVAGLGADHYRVNTARRALAELKDARARSGSFAR